MNRGEGPGWSGQREPTLTRGRATTSLQGQSSMFRHQRYPVSKTAAFNTGATRTIDRGQNADALELRRPRSVAAIIFGALHSHAAAGSTVTTRVSVQPCAVSAAACGDVRHHKPLSTNDGTRETVPIRLRAESSF